MTVVREENGEEISEISVSKFNTVLTEVYNKALDDFEKLLLEQCKKYNSVYNSEIFCFADQLRK